MSADEVAVARRTEGWVVTVVDTRWGGRAVISSDAPAEEPAAEVEASRTG